MGNQSNKNEEVGLGWDNPPQLGAIFCYQSFIEAIGRSPEATISGCGQWLGSHPHIWGWVNTYRYIFSGMNIHLPAILGFTRYQGFDPSPYKCNKNIWRACIPGHIMQFLLSIVSIVMNVSSIHCHRRKVP